MGLRLGPNAALVGLTVGGTLLAAGFAMAACAVLATADGRAALAFVFPAAVTLSAGAGLVRASTAARHHGLTVRPVTGLLAVTLAWVAASAAGAVPLLAAGTFSSPIDA